MRLVDDEDFEVAARRFRIALGIDGQLRPDMITVIVKLKHLGLIKNYVRVPDAEMPDDEAYYDSEKSCCIYEKLHFVLQTLCSRPLTS